MIERYVFETNENSVKSFFLRVVMISKGKLYVYLAVLIEKITEISPDKCNIFLFVFQK